MEKKSQDESFEIDLDNVSTAIGGTDLDLNSYSFNYSNMNSSIGVSTITLPSPSYTIGTGYSGQFLTSGSNGSSWTSSIGSGTVNIGTDGIDMAAGTDIKIDGKSLKEFMNKMEQRLAILVPDPKKLEKFEALKRAYEHYKTMESLCFPEEEK
jgi:hypothetical protein